MVARKCLICANVAKNLWIMARRDEEALKEVHGDQQLPPEADRPDDGRHPADQASGAVTGRRQRRSCGRQ